MEFDNSRYSGLLCAGKVRDAARYLSVFPDMRSRLEALELRMEGGRVDRAEDEWICALDGAYQEYYRDVFWRGAGRAEAGRALLERLNRLSGADCASIEEAEELLAAEVRGRGFHFLGGMTQGYYGPYIWRETCPRTCTVELPSGAREFTVYMMRGFVSRSWLDFVSLGASGAGGWQSEGELYCVESCFEDILDTPDFDAVFLRHEAQHALDRERHPEIFAGSSAWLAEYRAKLVELIYCPDMGALRQFLSEADGADTANSHSYASWRLIGELSRRIWGCEYESEFEKWEERAGEVKSAALASLRDSDTELDSVSSEKTV